MTNAEDFFEALINKIAARIVERLPQTPQAAQQPAAQNQQEYLTTRQAAKALALGTSTLELWRANGKGPAFVKVGSSVRYSRAELTAWLATRARRPQ